MHEGCAFDGKISELCYLNKEIYSSPFCCRRLFLSLVMFQWLPTTGRMIASTGHSS